MSLNGEELASSSVGVLPGQIVYYSPDLVPIDKNIPIPASILPGNNYLNPFNSSTSRPYYLEISGEVSLWVYDPMVYYVTALLNTSL